MALSTHQASVGSGIVDPEPAKSAARPPQQARSRAALQRLLAAAEHVLVNDGLDEFTIARVAEQAGVSVGGLYRRFASREQLIDAVREGLIERLETAVSEALETAQPSLGGVVHAFTAALGEVLAVNGRVIPVMLAGARGVDSPEQGLRTLTAMHQRFLAAAAPHRRGIRRSDPDEALDLVFRSVIAAGAHRAALAPWWPDGLSWQRWAGEVAEMNSLYLTSDR